MRTMKTSAGRTVTLWFALAAGIVACALVLPAAAFNPPVDTAGSLVVRIEGPEQATETGVPLPVRVAIENRSDAPVEGTLEIGLVDRWRVEPAGPQKFAVGSRGRASR